MITPSTRIRCDRADRRGRRSTMSVPSGRSDGADDAPFKVEGCGVGSARAESVRTKRRVIGAKHV